MVGSWPEDCLKSVSVAQGRCGARVGGARDWWHLWSSSFQQATYVPREL